MQQQELIDAYQVFLAVAIALGAVAVAAWLVLTITRVLSKRRNR